MNKISIDKIVVFLANSESDPLPTIAKESREINTILSSSFRNCNLHHHVQPFTTKASMVEYIKENKGDIVAFQFSGHAGKDELLVEDDVVKPKGLVRLLSQCRKLKLIILNGCSTYHQLELIRRLNFVNDPVIISTSAPVSDYSATEYSIAFWKAICQQKETIGEAHETALGTIQSSANVIQNKESLVINRKLGAGNEISIKDELWDINYKSETSLNHKLCSAKRIGVTQANLNLKSELVKIYTPASKLLQSKLEEGKSESEILTLILMELPLPISEQLRKLFARSSSVRVDDWQSFYDELGSARLQQIICAYRVLMELITFIHLAQLWEEIRFGRVKNWSSGISEIATYFSSSLKEVECFSLSRLIFSVNKIFKDNGIRNYIIEWERAKPALTDSNIALENANGRLLDILKKGNSISAAEAVELCQEAEQCLVKVFGSFNFIINYKMASIKAIHVNKHRHLKDTKFKHVLVDLKQDFGAAIKKLEPRNAADSSESLFTDTVFIEHKESGEKLNLTPFIIDTHSYDPGATLAKIQHLFMFENLDFGKLKCTYTHVYKREDNYLELKENENYEMLLEQLHFFYTEILNLTTSNEKSI